MLLFDIRPIYRSTTTQPSLCWYNHSINFERERDMETMEPVGVISPCKTPHTGVRNVTIGGTEFEACFTAKDDIISFITAIAIKLNLYQHMTEHSDIPAYWYSFATPQCVLETGKHFNNIWQTHVWISSWCNFHLFCHSLLCNKYT
jgi:hypothetical protein